MVLLDTGLRLSLLSLTLNIRVSFGRRASLDQSFTPFRVSNPLLLSHVTCAAYGALRPRKSPPTDRGKAPLDAEAKRRSSYQSSSAVYRMCKTWQMETGMNAKVNCHDFSSDVRGGQRVRRLLTQSPRVIQVSRPQFRHPC